MAGFNNDVMFADNVDFSGNVAVTGQIISDGQLLIGSTASPNIRASTLTAGSLLGVTNSAGGISIGIANGTTGELITYDGAGVPANVAVGTAAQVLTSNGVGVAPTFQAAGGGAWTLISTATASTSATIEFNNLSSSHFMYVVIAENVIPATDNVVLQFRTSTDNGGSFDAGASDYNWLLFTAEMDGSTGEVAEQDSADTLIRLTSLADDWGNSTNEQGSFRLYLINPSSTNFTKITWNINYGKTDGNPVRVVGDGVRLSAADVDAIQFLFATDEILTGTFKLYGVDAA